MVNTIESKHNIEAYNKNSNDSTGDSPPSEPRRSQGKRRVMPKALSEENFKEIHVWLVTKNIRVQVHNIHRHFADGVAVARLLKEMYPKLVDLNNYPSHSSINLKLSNWETLNYKVLSKLNMQLSKEHMENIVRASAGAIEKLLYKIMQLEQEHLQKLQNEQEAEWMRNDDIMMIPLERTVGDSKVTQVEKMILYSIYDEVYRSVELKEQLIRAEERKLAHYENLMKLRDQRIMELHKQLDRPN